MTLPFPELVPVIFTGQSVFLFFMEELSGKSVRCFEASVVWNLQSLFVLNGG